MQSLPAPPARRRRAASPRTPPTLVRSSVQQQQLPHAAHVADALLGASRLLRGVVRHTLGEGAGVEGGSLQGAGDGPAKDEGGAEHTAPSCEA